MIGALGLACLALLQVPSQLNDIGAKYRVKIEVANAAFTQPAKGYQIAGGKVDSDPLNKYAVLFSKEWNRYPASLISRANVTRIVFCAGLKVDQQERAAVPAFDLDSMYYDPVLGNYNAHYQQTVVHHEFFHMIDQRLRQMRVDPEWSSLNPTGFKYGTGGKNNRTTGIGELTKEIPGFLTIYGTTAVEEDKAELFAHMIVDPDFVMERTKTDSALASKVALLKKRLSQFDPGVTEAFWPKPAKG